jgi:hypothetical protein
VCKRRNFMAAASTTPLAASFLHATLSPAVQSPATSGADGATPNKRRISFALALTASHRSRKKFVVDGIAGLTDNPFSFLIPPW